jgi:hypothetical protein
MKKHIRYVVIPIVIGHQKYMDQWINFFKHVQKSRADYPSCIKDISCHVERPRETTAISNTFLDICYRRAFLAIRLEATVPRSEM